MVTLSQHVIARGRRKLMYECCIVRILRVSKSNFLFQICFGGVGSPLVEGANTRWKLLAKLTAVLGQQKPKALGPVLPSVGPHVQIVGPDVRNIFLFGLTQPNVLILVSLFLPARRLSTVPLMTQKDALSFVALFLLPPLSLLFLPFVLPCLSYSPPPCLKSFEGHPGAQWVDVMSANEPIDNLSIG